MSYSSFQHVTDCRVFRNLQFLYYCSTDATVRNSFFPTNQSSDFDPSSTIDVTSTCAAGQYGDCEDIGDGAFSCVIDECLDW